MFSLLKESYYVHIAPTFGPGQTAEELPSYHYAEQIAYYFSGPWSGDGSGASGAKKGTRVGRLSGSDGFGPVAFLHWAFISKLTSILFVRWNLKEDNAELHEST
jgi:hypothetical protein